MNILIWTWCASLLLFCVYTKPNEKKDEILGHRRRKQKTTTDPSKDPVRVREHERYLEEIRNIKPELWRFKDALTYSEQVSRRPLIPNSCRREYVQSKNYTRRSILPEYLMCDSMVKNYGEDVEKEALASLERRRAREKKAREEKERGNTREREEKERRNPKEQEEREGERTTIHPLFRTKSPRPTMSKDKCTNSTEIFEASSAILHEMDAEVRRRITGDSRFYENEYYDEWNHVPIPESKSLSSDYGSFENWYNDYMSNPPNNTTPHYAWWSYDPNVTCVKYHGVPLDYDRQLYSLKMSSRLPANISAEIDAAYNQKSMIDLEYANKIEKSQEAWGKTANLEYNSDAGPVTLRRELHEPFEIIQNRYMDMEQKFGSKFEKDVRKYFINPAKKGLYRMKHWLNPKYTSTTKRIAMTWPAHSMSDQEMLDRYKKFLREEKNISSVRDSQGISIFDKYKDRFTADSNYYDETNEDLPWATRDLYK